LAAFVSAKIDQSSSDCAAVYVRHERQANRAHHRGEQGIGLETARQLGQRGMTVLVGARDHEHGTRAIETLRSEGLDARLIDLDVTDAASIKQCVTCIERDVGRLDVLVNNAGIILGRPKPSETQLDEVPSTATAARRPSTRARAHP
jgi:NAD(P)-dependent dehydrogenase (short-subunit alcohol dehydrogenase family)